MAQVGIVKSSAVLQHRRLGATFYLGNDATAKALVKARENVLIAQARVREAEKRLEEGNQRIAAMLVDGATQPVVPV